LPKGTPSALSSGAVTALSTVVVNGASAAIAVLIAHRFGHTKRTDGFFNAFGVYVTITLAAAAFRVVVLPPLTRARTEGRLRGEFHAFAAALGLLAAPLLVAAVVVGAAARGGPTADAFASALPWLVAAGVLQLFAGLAASTLAAFDSYGAAATAYAAGAVCGVGLFAALPGHGLEALEWGLLLNGAVTAGALLTAVGAHGLHGGAVSRVGARAGSLARGAAVPVALQLLFVIGNAFALRVGSGKATTFSYAFIVASFLVSVTASALSLVSSAPLTRRGVSVEAAVRHVVNASWLSLAAIGAAVGVFALVGTKVVSTVLGSAYHGADGHELVRLVVFLTPWMVASVAVTVAFPLLFVADRQRVLLPLAVALPLLQVVLAWALGAAFGLDGLALAMAATTFVALAALMAGLSRRAPALTAAGLVRPALVVAATAALSFGALGAALGGFPAAVVGLALYGALLLAARPLGLRDAWTYLRAL
jgi:hypothetical protein